MVEPPALATPRPFALLRSTRHGRAFYAARAYADAAAAVGRYLYQRSTKAMDLLFVNR